MVSDSIANASIPSAAFNSKDMGKKKRARTAKLKQCKLDVRREQWLSQGTAKNSKCCKDEPDNNILRGAGTGNKENNQSLGNLEIRPRGKKESPEIHHNDSDSESLSNTPTSPASSVLGGNDSGTNFTSSSSSSSSSFSGGFCSGSISAEEEEEDDGCLDDWEAVADALAAQDEEIAATAAKESQAEPKPVEAAAAVPPREGKKSGRAWRPDDTCRPQSLPNLAKQLSMPISDHHRNHHQQHYTAVPWAPAAAAPTSCPICTEDLDLTDSSFLPCLCEFRLCLFCYKRIIEDDGRCPGCRKPYEQAAEQGGRGSSGGGGGFALRLARSCSMFSRT